MASEKSIAKKFQLILEQRSLGLLFSNCDYEFNFGINLLMDQSFRLNLDWFWVFQKVNCSLLFLSLKLSPFYCRIAVLLLFPEHFFLDKVPQVKSIRVHSCVEENCSSKGENMSLSQLEKWKFLFIVCQSLKEPKKAFVKSQDRRSLTNLAVAWLTLPIRICIQR